jgi:hypothetical protein
MSAVLLIWFALSILTWRFVIYPALIAGRKK